MSFVEPLQPTILSIRLMSTEEETAVAGERMEGSLAMNIKVNEKEAAEPIVDAGLTDTALPQIVVNKMPRHSKKKDFEKYLAKLSLKYRKMKVIPNKDFAFITFDNDADCQAAIAALHGTEYRKSVLEIATRTHNTSDNGSKKRSGDDDRDDDRGDKRQRADAPIKTARDAVSPWWDVPYEEQLVRKTKAMVKDCLNKSFREVRDSYFKWNKAAKWEGREQITVPSWITETKEAKGDNELSWVEYLPIIASPEPIGYRNKCEFTFGVDSLDQQPAVGFRVSTFNQGVLVGSPQDCPNISKPMKMLVSKVNEFIRETSKLKVYDMHAHTGVWRLLTVRYSKRTQQMIVMLCVSLKAVAKEVWAEELTKFSDCILSITRTSDIDCEGVEVSVGESEEEGVAESGTVENESGTRPPLVTGLCYQVYDGLSVPASDHEVISAFGEMTIIEKMNGCSFRVSPQAFFQVNTPCAELLYSSVMQAMQGDAVDSAPCDNSNLLCLDVCSGTGTIGICCAKQSMGHMIGVELCQAAVNDAIDNATLNGLTLFVDKAKAETAQDDSVVVDTEASSQGQSQDQGVEEKGTIVTDVGDARINKYECGFICSRAEAVLESLIGQKRAKPGVDLRPFQAMAHGKKVLAVVDPPREGLHVDCLRAIRNCSRIDRLVYVSCNPTKSLPRDLAMLCGPSNKKLPGKAFRPVKATPVDLFPHTPHCEMLLVLERC